MTARAYFGWDYARIGTFSARFTDTGGSSTITFATGTYCWLDLSSVMGASLYTAFATQLQTTLNADVTLNGTYTVTFDTTDLDLRIECDENTTVDVLNTVAQQIMGASSATFMTASQDTTGPNQCYYALKSTFTTRGGDDIDTYEDEETSVVAIAGASNRFALKRASVPVFRDYLVPHVPRADVITADVVSTAPYSWEAGIKHARSVEPVVFADDFASTVGHLRQGFDNWKHVRRQIEAGYRGHFDIDLRTHERGTL